MKSHAFEMCCYFSAHFNNVSKKQKIEIVIQFKNQNAYNKFQVQLSAVT
jgi:hypothetical protein